MSQDEALPALTEGVWSVTADQDASLQEVLRHAVELEEEAGLTAGAWQHLGFLHAGYGRSTNGFDVFLAEDLHQVPPRREIEEQDMRSGTFTLDEVWGLIRDGRMTDSHSIAALALWERARQT